MDAHLLERLGLTTGEVKVYLSLIKLGQSTTGPISKESKVSPSKVYDILEKLIKKGLVGFVYKEKTKYFQASQPEKLLSYVENQEKEILERKELLQKKIIPELKLRAGLKETTYSAIVYEGLEGMKTVFNNFLDHLNSDEEYLVFTVSTEELKEKCWQLFFRSFHLRRIEKKIHVRIIAPEDSKPAMKKIFSGLKYVKIHYTSQKIPHNTSMYKDRLVFTIFQPKLIAIEINAPELARHYKSLFEEVWNQN